MLKKVFKRLKKMLKRPLKGGWDLQELAGKVLQ
jgi:hypothetical protein